MKIQAEKTVYNLSNENCYIKTKKCQPAARDTTDLIQTVGVPDRGLARPQIKISERKKLNPKMKIRAGKSVLEKCYKKNKKVSACCQGHHRSNSN